MESLDTVSIGILLGAILVLSGILSSLVALRFGAPLLLVFLLIHSRGLRLRPRVAGTLEVESGTNDPFAVFMTIVLVNLLMAGEQPWTTVLISFAREAILGTIIGLIGGRVVVWALNRLGLAQGLHAPFVCTSALV